MDMMQQHPYIHIEKEIYEKFADDISEYFPELHWSYSYDTIEADGAAKAFSHLYFTLWRSGVLELLYKAALPNLAFAVQTELAENINRTGTRPQDIFGLPLHMLRILDSYGQDAEKTLEYAIFYRKHEPAESSKNEGCVYEIPGFYREEHSYRYAVEVSGEDL